MKNNTLYKKIVLLSIGIMLFLSFVLFFVFSNYYRREFMLYEYELIKSDVYAASDKTNMKFSEYMRIIDLAGKDPGVLSLCEEERSDETLYSGRLTNFLSGASGVASLALVTKNENVYFSVSSLSHSVRDEYLKYANFNGFTRRFKWVQSHVADYAVNANFNIVKLLSDIYDEKYQYMGTLIINIREDAFLGVADAGSGNGNSMYLMADINGNILSCSPGTDLSVVEHRVEEILQKYKKSMSYEGSVMSESRSNPYIIAYKKLPEFQIFEIGFVSTGFIDVKINEFLIRMALIVLLLIIPCVMGSLLIAQSIYRPVKSLAAAMRNVENGNLDISLTVEKNDEMGRLAAGFNSMVSRLKKLIEQINRNAVLEKELEIKALQSQINPHLLYNTLASIIWLLESGEKEKTIGIVSKLGKYYRLSLSKKESLISLKTELEHLRLYMDIECERLNNSFSYVIETQDGLLDVKCPRILLQPLVENSIIHGIKAKAGGSVIIVKVKRRGESLIIQIFDDGIGIKKEALAGINKTLETMDINSFGKSYGIYNIQSRIKLTYGCEYGLKYYSKEGKGTLVRIKLHGKLGEQ